MLYQVLFFIILMIRLIRIATWKLSLIEMPQTSQFRKTRIEGRA